MLTKKEKQLMLKISDMCENKSSTLIPFSEAKKMLTDKPIEDNDLVDTFIVLYKHDLLNFEVSNGKDEKYMLIEIKKKGYNYKSDLKRERRKIALIILRTVALALLSFLVTLLLRNLIVL